MSAEPRLTAVPAARSRLPVLQIRLAAVLGSLLLAAVMGIVSTVAWMTNQPPTPDYRLALPQGKAVAELAAVGWLEGTPLVVPALENVTLPDSPGKFVYTNFTWEGFNTDVLPNGFPYELHRFIVSQPIQVDSTRTSNRLLRLTVAVMLSGGKGYLAAVPAIEPVDMRGVRGVFDYSDVSDNALPGGAQAQVEKWASSWASDNRDQLKLLTGDTTAGIEYPGLGGFTATQTIVENALPAGNTVIGGLTYYDAYLVRVRISLTGSGANQFMTESEMDLTVVNASSGLPLIIGWGPAGAGLRGPADTRRAS